MRTKTMKDDRGIQIRKKDVLSSSSPSTKQKIISERYVVKDDPLKEDGTIFQN